MPTIEITYMDGGTERWPVENVAIEPRVKLDGPPVAGSLKEGNGQIQPCPGV